MNTRPWSDIKVFCMCFVPVLAVGTMPGSAQTNTPSPLPAYVKLSDGVTSNLLFVTGSRELDGVMRLWGAIYLRSFGHARMELQGSDSVHCVGRLLDTPGCLGIMSRPMRAAEENALQQGLGTVPVTLRVAADFVVVCVHKDNPIVQAGIPVEKLDAVFSKTRKAGATEEIKTWGQMGLTGEWADKPVIPYACASASPLTDFFVQSVMRDGEFKEGVQYGVRDGEPADMVSSNRYGIGFSSLRLCGNGVALAPISAGQGKPSVPPVPANFGAYPLTRYVYACLAGKPGQAVDGNRREILKVIFSKEGQSVAAQAGYVPVSFDFAKAELAKIDVSLSPAAGKPGR